MVPARRLLFADLKHHRSLGEERRRCRKEIGAVISAAGIVSRQVETDTVAPCGNLPPVLHKRHASLLVRDRRCNQSVSSGAVALEADRQPARRPALARVQDVRRNASDSQARPATCARDRAGYVARYVRQAGCRSDCRCRGCPRWSRDRFVRPRQSAPEHVTQPLLRDLLLLLRGVVQFYMDGIGVPVASSEECVSERRVPQARPTRPQHRTRSCSRTLPCLEIKPERQPRPGPHFHSENSFP